MNVVSWAGVPVSSVIAAKVDARSDAAGMPRNVLRAFVLGESNGDPNIIGDAGESAGLLQLHARGQGAGMTIAERQDPDRNLDVGVPPIVSAWNRSASMPYDRARVERVALTSGHPTENVDLLTPGTKAWRIAMAGAKNIGNWWDKLERDNPSAAVVVAAPVAPASSATAQIVGRVNQAAAWATENPGAALAAGAGVLALLLL